MTHSEDSPVYRPPISPLRHALNVITNRGRTPQELKRLVLDGSALDTEEDESPQLSPPTPRQSPLPSPQFSFRRSQSTGTKSRVSPRLGLGTIGRTAVSLARRASASANGGVRKWQPGEKQRRSPSRSPAKLPSLLFSPPDSPPALNDPSTGIASNSLLGAPLSSPPDSLSALDVPLASFPSPSSPMSLPPLSPVADDDIIPVAPSASMADVSVPLVLQKGTPMIKVSGRKQKNVVFRLDPDRGQIIWESKKHRISTSLLGTTTVCLSILLSLVPIENIKELRTASDARYYRELFQISQECENRWLTIIYTLDGCWKIWHVIAPSVDVFHMWDSTLHELYAVRQTLMRGLGNFDLREALWAKQCWKAADEQAEQKMCFEDVEKLCKRLNVNSSRDDLYRHFKVFASFIFLLAMG